MTRAALPVHSLALIALGLIAAVVAPALILFA
jgi:hypothetical protein